MHCVNFTAGERRERRESQGITTEQLVHFHSRLRAYSPGPCADSAALRGFAPSQAHTRSLFTCRLISTTVYSNFLCVKMHFVFHPDRTVPSQVASRRSQVAS
jgi:hypothetical protein